MQKGAERVLKVISERDDLSLRIRDKNVSKKDLRRKLWEQDITENAMQVSVEQLENKSSSIKKEKRPLAETCISYGKDVLSEGS